MAFRFTAKIEKVGINPCVPVPLRITKKMTIAKGYIPVKGTINGYSFTQTLVPVAGAEYRLYVNGPMLKGGNAKNGDTANFTIEQNSQPEEPEMLPALKKALSQHRLTSTFNQLTAYRRKEILRYLNNLKTTESQERNINKVLAQLKR